MAERWLQYFVYLLQTFDIYLGYDYLWRIRGPYDSNLAACRFALRGIYDKIPSSKTAFEDSNIQDRFKKFQKFVKNKETDADFLEIASTLHCLKHDEDIRDMDSADVLIRHKHERFTDSSKYKMILKAMKKWKII